MSLSGMNPYKPPATQPVNAFKDSPSRPIGPFIITIILVVAALVGILSTFFASIRAVTMPRFGWVGLIVCLNPLIFLVPWFWRPTRTALIASAFMMFALGAINAVQLYSTGTVPIVVNEFHDRLHSSWLWSVLSFFAAGLYLSYVAMWTPSAIATAIKGEQSIASKPRLHVP